MAGGPVRCRATGTPTGIGVIRFLPRSGLGRGLLVGRHHLVSRRVRA